MPRSHRTPTLRTLRKEAPVYIAHCLTRRWPWRRWTFAHSELAGRHVDAVTHCRTWVVAQPKRTLARCIIYRIDAGPATDAGAPVEWTRASVIDRAPSSGGAHIRWVDPAATRERSAS